MHDILQDPFRDCYFNLGYYFGIGSWLGLVKLYLKFPRLFYSFIPKVFTYYSFDMYLLFSIMFVKPYYYTVLAARAGSGAGRQEGARDRMRNNED